MASLYASRSGVTTNLSNGSPFAFESLQDVGSAPVARYKQRGPLQHGVTDLGFRVQPRTITLNLRFYAATDAALDTHRQTLMDTFAPLTDISTFLYYDRDDGTTLRLTVFTVDEIEIDLVPEHRPGHLHRATLKLRAANPLWLDTTLRATTITALDAASSQWWLGGGTIAPSVVLEYGTVPTNGQAWTYAGTTGGLRPLTIALRMRPTVFTNTYAFFISNGGTTNYYINHPTVAFAAGSPEVAFNEASSAGTLNYMWAYNGVSTSKAYRNGTVQIGDGLPNLYVGTASTRRWRSNASGTTGFWEYPIARYAIYDQELSSGQRVLLDQYMTGNPTSFVTVYLSAVNAGDIPAYPAIKLVGPMSNITVTNSTTGASFSLGTTAIALNDVYTIDLRDGDKQVYGAGGVNRLNEVTTPVALANFFLAPSPMAAGGTNTIIVAGNGTDSNSRVTIEHYNQYMSF